MLPIHFAPLQGYTDCVYRSIHAKFAGGVETYYTPFIRWEKGDVRNKDMRDIQPQNNVGLHLIPQIICGSTDEFNRLCDMVQAAGYREIDLNMGCPAPMQTKLNRGSGILPHPDLVSDLVRQMEARPEVTYSVKMRLGLEQAEEWKQILPILNDSSLGYITLHPRVGKQMYKGTADIEAFQRFAVECSKPLIYNGDLQSIEDIQRIEHLLPELRAVMLGRALLGRPTMASEYKEGKEWALSRRQAIIKAMHSEMLEFCRIKYVSDSQILLHIHAFWEYQQDTMERKAYKKIMKAGSMKNYLAAVSDYLR